MIKAYLYIFEDEHPACPYKSLQLGQIAEEFRTSHKVQEIEGMFLTKEELKNMWDAAREGIGTESLYNDYDYKTFEDYMKDKGER